MRSTLIAMTAVAVALGGCNRPNADGDHPKVDYTTSLMSRMSAADIDRVTTPPAPPQRGPIPPDANAADPATNASAAFANQSGQGAIVPPPGSDHSIDGVHIAVMAQEAASKAPDTASADEARRKVYEDAATGAIPSNDAAKSREAQQKSGSTSTAQESADGSGSDPMAAQSNPPAARPANTAEKS